MKVEHNIFNNVLFLFIDGDLLGETNGLEIIDLISNYINKGILRVVFDLSNVRYMNSSGIGVLITAYTKLKNKKGELLLVNPNDQINKLFLITKLNTIFKIFPNKQEALEYFKG
jgi:anti-sigma B factor antagonist